MNSHRNLVSFACSVSLFLIFTCAANGQEVPNELRGSGDSTAPTLPAVPPQTAPAQTPDAAGQGSGGQESAQRTGAISQLVREVSSLVPGGISEGSAAEQALMNAAVAFADNNLDQVRATLQSVRESDPRMPPVDLMEAAMRFAANDAAGGQQRLERAAIEFESNPAVFLAFSRLAVNQRRFTDAVALLDLSVRKIQAGSFDEVELQHYQTLYYDMSAEVALRQKRYNDARGNISRLLEVSSDKSKGSAMLAELEFDQGNPDESVRLLEEFRSTNPGSRVPELVIAGWLQDRNRIDEIDDWVKKAAVRYPEDRAVQLEYANNCVNREQFADANDALKKVEAVDGESPVTILLKAKVAFASEAYNLAAPYYKQLAEAQGGQNLEAANLYALSLIEVESDANKQLARQIAENNYRTLPDSQTAQASLAWILWKTGEKENALNLFSRATRGPGLPPEIAFFVAHVMQEQGQLEQAISVLSSAADTPGFFLYRSRAKALLEKLQAENSSELPEPSGG